MKKKVKERDGVPCALCMTARNADWLLPKHTRLK